MGATGQARAISPPEGGNPDLCLTENTEMREISQTMSLILVDFFVSLFTNRREILGQVEVEFQKDKWAWEEKKLCLIF